MNRTLLVVVLALAAWLYFQARQPAAPVIPVAGPGGEPQQSDVTMEPPGEGSPDVDTHVSRGSPDDYVAMVERPLFMESRRPEDKTKRAAAAAIEASEEDLRLTAVAISGRGRYALIRKGRDGETVRLKEGAEVDGWSLVDVSPQAVTLRRGEDLRMLPLLREVIDEPEAEPATNEEPADQSLVPENPGDGADTGDETPEVLEAPGLPDEPEAETRQPGSPDESNGDASAKDLTSPASAGDGDEGAANGGVTAGE